MTSLPPSKNSCSQDKPVLLFTNFWDANTIVSNRCCIVAEENTYHQVNFFQETAMDGSQTAMNFKFVSIALQSPPLQKMPLIREYGMKTQDDLCPTYEILMEYKKTKNWDVFSKKYMELVASRKLAIRQWIDSLENKVYICCCWENTSGKAKCHRSLLFDAFKKSAYVRNKVVLLYRDGSLLENDLDSRSFGDNVIIRELPEATTNSLPHQLVFRLEQAGLVSYTDKFAPPVLPENVLTEPVVPDTNRRQRDPFDLPPLEDIDWGF